MEGTSIFTISKLGDDGVTLRFTDVPSLGEPDVPEFSYYFGPADEIMWPECIMGRRTLSTASSLPLIDTD